MSLLYAFIYFLIIVEHVLCQPRLEINPRNFFVTEGKSFDVTVRKTGVHQRDIIAVLYFRETEAAYDFRGSSYVLHFRPDVEQLHKTFFVEADDIPEGREIYHLSLRTLPGSGEATIGQDATVVIEPNDDAFGVLGFEINHLRLREGQEPAVITVNRYRGADGRVSAQLAISKVINRGVKAKQSKSGEIEDLEINNQNIVFMDQQRQAVFQLTAVDDQIPEDDEEFIIELVQISNGARTNETSNQLKVIIPSNDAPIRLLKSGYITEERNTSIDVVITRGQIVDPLTGQAHKVGPLSTRVQVPYSIVSTSPDCRADVDFVSENSFVVFEPGVLEQKIRVTIIDDNLPEADEQFAVELGPPKGDAVLIAPARAVITIRANDDTNGVLVFAPDDSSNPSPVRIVNEDTQTEIALTIRRLQGSFGQVSVNWTLIRIDSREPPESDLRPTMGTVIFGPGETEKEIRIFVVQDTEPEKIEKFSVFLKSVRGGARLAAENLPAVIILQDSDAAHGVIEFANPQEQKIIPMNGRGRGLRLLLARNGGTNGDLIIDYMVEYTSGDARLIGNLSGVLETRNNRFIMPDCESSYQFVLPINDSAFLPVGSTFTVKLLNVTLNPVTIYDPHYRPYNSPILGRYTTATIVLDLLLANGELGFSGPSVVYVDEPEDKEIVLEINVFRNGTSGEAWVDWEIVRQDQLLVPGEDYILPENRSLLIRSGSERAKLVLRVLPDNIPELDEELVLKLTNVRPSDSQRLSANNSQLRIIFRENDNPAGEFGITDPSGSVTIEEGKDPIMLTIRRSGGYLANRRVEVFAVEDVNRTEFLGLPTVVEFRDGVAEQKVSFMAASDGIPELSERFTISIRSFRDAPITIANNRATLAVTIPENDDPYGVFQFSDKDISKEMREGGEPAEFVVKRTRGSFGFSAVTWKIEFIPQPGSAAFADPKTQFRVSSGQLQFEQGETTHNFMLALANDAIPEPLEHYQVRLVSVEGGARLSKHPAKLVADLYVPQNDYQIQFGNADKITVKEGTRLQMDIVRENVSSECSVRISTVDMSAKANRDFTPLAAQLVTFGPLESHKVVLIDVIDDEEPEADEKFKVILSDPTGECVTFGTTIVTVTIANNDEASGIFRFEPPATYIGNEGLPVKIGVLREKSYFGSVTLMWRVVTPAGCKEFSPANGSVTFNEGEIVKKFDVIAVDDDMPEFNETYEIELFQLFDTESSRIANDGRLAKITIVENDQPYGLITFPIAFREVRVDEDYLPGQIRTTRVTLDVYRLRGLNGTIRAVWEMYSYGIAGKIPPFRDLLLDAPEYIIRHDEMRRPYTQTNVFEFKGEPVFMQKRRIPGAEFFSEGFGISLWIKPSLRQVGEPAFLFTKANAQSGQTEFAVALQIGHPNELFIQLRTQRLIAMLPSTLTDGKWHFIAINCFEKIDVKRDKQRNIGVFLDLNLVKNFLMESGPDFSISAIGRIVIGADAAGTQPFFGFIQDFRLYSRPIQDGEMQELHSLPSQNDIRSVNGYVQFASGQQSDSLTLATVDDAEEEANEVFSVKLMDVSGGAEILSSDGSAKVTVLKSDNANGLFMLRSCKPETDVEEGEMINCTIERQRGDADQVSVSWHVNEVKPDGLEVVAERDFTEARGNVIFNNGIRELTLSLLPRKDGDAEGAERFILLLEGTAVADGEIGSTPTSGASIHHDFDRSEIWIKPNDWPNGLFQFCQTTPCLNKERPIKPVKTMPIIAVTEESGSLLLTIQRSQGLMGKVTVEFRTVDGAAKAHADYQAAAGFIGLEEGEDMAEINITIYDNSLPEPPKFFFVELLNPTGGSEVSKIAGRVKIIIAESDFPYGVFDFDNTTCGGRVFESDGANIATIPLKIIRIGGTYEAADVRWQVTKDGIADIRPSSGIATFRSGQKAATVLVEVVDDELPELPEIVTFKLVDASRGVVAEDATCNFTIGGNDNPYGEFYIGNDYRPMIVHENGGEIPFKISRRAGLFGRVQVSFRVLASTDDPPVPFSSGQVIRRRAKFGRDFKTRTQQALLSVIFEEGQSEKLVPIGSVIDDTDPEDDETFYVILTSVRVVDLKFTFDGGDAPAMPRTAVKQQRPSLQNRTLVSSDFDKFFGQPTIAGRAESYAEIVIAANDDAHGILRLSHEQITVYEGRQMSQNSSSGEEFPLRVLRERGSYGKVGVKFRLENGTAIEHQDFEANGGYEVWLDHGEIEKALPILIVDDLMPEPGEVFAVSLLPQSATGGATVGLPKRAVVTIAASDSPNGLLVFKQPAHQTVEEPQGNRVLVDNIIVRRKRGLNGIVKARWMATINGKPAVDDVQPVNGTLYFNTGADSASIGLYVLADDVPEYDEVVDISLEFATDGAELGPHAERVYRLTIKANDNPHGSIEFDYQEYAVWENPAPVRHAIGIHRSGGTFGTLYVTYIVEALNISEMLDVLDEKPSTFFNFGFRGYRRTSNPSAFRFAAVQNYGDELLACQLECLADRQCDAFDIGIMSDIQTGTNKQSCRIWIVGERFNRHSDVVISNGSEYWVKSRYKAEELLYGRWATDQNVDFTSGTFYTTIPSGERNSSLPVTIMADGIPELNETFRIRLESVQLVNWTENRYLEVNKPTLGKQSSAFVTILQNNDANGRLTLSLLSGGNYIEVDEADRAVDMVITRQGGSMGRVAVTWAVDRTMSSATSVGDMFNAGDFTGDSATLYFDPGVTVQTFSLSIKDDQIPEERETITVYLKQPDAGAVLGDNSTVVIVIRANDHVAGVIGFDNDDFVVSEGDTVTLTVSRTQPAKGRVSIPWTIVDQYNNTANLSSLSLNEGKLFFIEGETKQNITLYVIPDRVPEFGEKYTVQLMPPETQGIDRDGGSILNQTQSTAIIFVRPSDDPHGVFGLVREVSRFSESDPRPVIQVKRRYGEWGDVIITYSVEEATGDQRPLRRGDNTVTATENKDFRGQKEATAIMRNGTWLLDIPLTIVDDNEPELDEIFAVRLIAVRLHPDWITLNGEGMVDTPFPPRISAAMSSGFVIIAANDGTLGELAFRDAHLSLDESVGSVDIVVDRHRGDFGNISVYIYASARTTLTSDFVFLDQTLYFAPGQRNVTVNMTIIDDDVPEPPEVIELILASPNPEGVVLGTPQRMTIEIRANDGAAGTIGFAMPPGPIRMSEPNERPGAVSNVTIFVERRPGHFGVSSVQLEIVPLSAYPVTGNLVASNTSLIFLDGQSRVSFWVAVPHDTIPEERQRYGIVLRNPTGGARLDENSYQIQINISASDYPRGLLKLCLKEAEGGACQNSLQVDELPGQQHLPIEITREFGTKGNISVDLITIPQTATYTRDANKILVSPLQLLYGSETVRWYAFKMYGFTYFLMLSSTSPGPLAAFDGAGQNGTEPDESPYLHQHIVDNVAQSTWFRWQGSLVAVQPLQTENAVAATSFEENGIHYLVIANFGMPTGIRTKTRVYRVYPDGTLAIHQDIDSIGVRDVAAFYYGPQLYLAMANFIDEDGNTVLQLSVHEWSRHVRFFFDSGVKTTRTEGARRVLPFTIRNNTYVLIVNYFASEVHDEGLSCRLYWYGTTSGHFELKQGIEAPSAVDAQFATLNELDHFLAIATAKLSSPDSGNETNPDGSRNSGDSIVIYKWHLTHERFIPIQTIEAARVRQLNFHLDPRGHSLELITAEEAGPSRIFRWSQPVGKFLPVWSGHSACGLYPAVIQQPSIGQPLELLIATNCDGIRSVVYSLNRIDPNLGDFAPIGITFTLLHNQFGPLTSMLTILDDDEPELNETFILQLRNPLGDCEIAENESSIAIMIESNDNAFGVIEFTNDSLVVEVDEIVGLSNFVFLNLVREGGTFGDIRVRWQVMPPDGGYRDISPLFGEVVFDSGQNSARIQLTIPDDMEPELDETATVVLEQLGPSSAPARIGEHSMAKIIILANDSPHGVIGWESAIVTAYEEPRDYRKTVFIVREQGTEGTIEIHYQVIASSTGSGKMVLDTYAGNSNQTLRSLATPGSDFVPVLDGKVTMTNGQKRVPIGVTILADDLPEEAEQFTLNLTSVRLAPGERRRGAPPSIKRQRQAATVVIPANDDANGVVEFDISRLPSTVTAYEIVGQDATLELPIVRHTGSAGRLIVHWETRPGTASPSDYAPAMGTVTFEDNQRSASLIIAILDDAIPENDETFDVLLTQVTGGGRLGVCNTIKVIIKRNDSPHGVFAFDFAQPMFDAIGASEEQDMTNLLSNFSLVLSEPVRDFDPASQLTVRVLRQHGTEGTVKIRWVLSANATEDFLPPFSGILTFAPGEVVKEICLRAKADDQLEGTEAFILSLVPNDTLAELSPAASDAVVIIRADPGASGVVRVKPGYEKVVVAEPPLDDSEYQGKVEIVLIRENGIYGEVAVDWQIGPAGGRGRFLTAEGQVIFEDRHNEASIVLQVRDDDIPQIAETYELRLLSAVASAASLDHNHSTVGILIVASDWPFGFFRIKAEPIVYVDEDAKSVPLIVERRFGTLGAVDVTFTTSADTASPRDFKPIAGRLLFLAGQTRMTLEIPIFQDDQPEPNEQFFVNLTGVTLRSPYVNDLNLTRLQIGHGKWVTPDLAPALDPAQCSASIVISANDNSAGIVAFQSSTADANEEAGRVELVITRQPGTYGRIIIKYRIEGETAKWTEDFIDLDGEVTVEDGESNATISIRLTDDAMPEGIETFTVTLVNVTGGALIDRGLRQCRVTIAKSDYPNGRFAFVGATRMKLPNVANDTEQIARIERSLGGRTKQRLTWRLYGPDDKTLPTKDDTDICPRPNAGGCAFQGTMEWDDGEEGWRDLALIIRGHRNIWEPEKKYWLKIVDVMPIPPTPSEAGEIDINYNTLSITIAKFGHPNGVFRFVGESLTLRTISEPEMTGMSVPLTFRIERRNSSIGKVTAKWELRGPIDTLSPDVQPLSGNVSFENGQSIADFAIFILPDNIPELREQFVVALVGATGGAELDERDIFAQFLISANDNPYGVFSINSSNQRVIVKRNDMSRTLLLNFTRNAGTFGRAKLTYTLRHESPPGRASGLLPRTESIEFDEGKAWASEAVRLSRGSRFFLHPESNFTIQLIRVELLDAQKESLSPLIAELGRPTLDANMAKVKTSSEAANSIVSFEDPISLVDEATGVARVVVVRRGSYGNLRLYWTQDAGKEGQFTAGRMEPVEGSLEMSHGEERGVIWVRPNGEPEACRVFRIHFVGDHPESHVDGGAEFGPNEDHRTTDIERYGLVRIAQSSREVQTGEDAGRVSIAVERLYGSLAPIMVYYTIVPGTAKPGLDYETPASAGSLLISNGQTTGTISVTVNSDAEPEPAEWFFVNLTRIVKLPTDVVVTEVPRSPRISQISNSSMVTIGANSDPFGVLTIDVERANISESSRVVNIIVNRLVGASGEVAVTVRTASTSEPWLVEVERTTLWPLLSSRPAFTVAITEVDYRLLDKVVVLQSGQRQAKVPVRLIEDDIPEGDETFAVYLSRPVGGARLATETEGKWFKLVTIERNDLWNGRIGFDCDQRPVIKEDTAPNATLALRRSQSMFGDAFVFWEAIETQNTPKSIDLRRKLVQSRGTAQCRAFAELCYFNISIVNDDLPETEWEFAVRLSGANPGAQLNTNATTVTVNVENSDDPFGLIRFAPNSVFVPVSHLAAAATLRVQRIRGADRTVRVDVQTYQLPEEVIGDGGEVLLPAVDKVDFHHITETIIFRPGVMTAQIVVPLGGPLSPTRQLPRMFQVVLSNPTSGARVDERFSIANVTIVRPEELTSWQAVAQALVADVDVISTLKLVQDSALSFTLSEAQLGRLESVLSAAASRPLSQSARDAAFNTLCNLANPKRKDAVVGRTALARILDNLVLTSLAQTTNCSTTSQTSYQQFYSDSNPVTAACSHFSFQAVSAKPSELRRRSTERGFTFRGKLGDWVRLPDELIDKLASASMTSPPGDNIFSASLPTCANVAFIEYSSTLWFDRPSEQLQHELIGDKVLTVAVPNEELLWRHGEGFGVLDSAVQYRIHMPNHAIAPSHARCYYMESTPSAVDNAWHGELCTVENDLSSGTDNFVQCRCRHFSSYGARIPRREGYPAYFAAALGFSSLLLLATLICHHVRSPHAQFSASLNMHLIFASFATQVIYAIDVLLSRSHLLVLTTLSTSDHYKCTIVGVILHYFFTAQFTWIFTQALNLWRIFVLNDEHTRRKYVWFFMLGWGVPAFIVAIFYAGAFHVFKQFYASSTRAEAAIYGNVGNYGDICFVTDAIAGAVGVIVPAVLPLLTAAGLFVHAFQLRAQWHAYDDLYRGRFNSREISLLLPWWACTAITWLWGGLHLAFNDFWWLLLFLSFSVIQSIYVFFVYGICRTPCFERVCCWRCNDTRSSVSGTSALGGTSDRLISARNLPATMAHHMANKQIAVFSDLILSGDSSAGSTSGSEKASSQNVAGNNCNNNSSNLIGQDNRGALFDDSIMPCYAAPTTTADEQSSVGLGDVIYGYDESTHHILPAIQQPLPSQSQRGRQPSTSSGLPLGARIMPDIHL